MSYRLGVDVGGTFTDLIVIDQARGGPLRDKAHGMPADSSQAVVAGAQGVVADENGKLDEAATTELRTEMPKTRSMADAIFNFGGDIETLHANCEAETGLPAPEQPVWRNAFAEAAE